MANGSFDGTYSEFYSAEDFWEKSRRHARSAGKRAIYYALILYYALGLEETPAWAKAVITSALGYFIFPVDAIPDMVPVVGYTDDAGVLAAAIAMVIMHINPEAKTMAKQKMRDWFGESVFDDEDWI